MSLAARRPEPLSRFEQLRFAQDVLRTEAGALAELADRLGPEFCDAVEQLAACRGSVIVTGMGKAGLIGRKIAATLASTGARSHYLHPGEAVHGDLGRVDADDVALVLSYSGETDEIVRLLPLLRRMQVPVLAVTGRPDSALGRAAHITLDLGPLREACSLGLAPSTSTTAMLGLGDALALVLSRLRRFAAEDFARFHPAGSLGRKLMRVEEVMRPLAECRIARDSQTVREVFLQDAPAKRRTGAVMLVDERGVLTGIFTDSDLCRLVAEQRDRELDRPIREVMTRNPKTVPTGGRLDDAVAELDRHRISELPIVDADGGPQGLIDVTDVIGLLPRSVAD